MADLRLKMATLHHGQWDALKDGRVKPEGIELENIEVDPPNRTYRRMVRDFEFDIAEMATTTFLCAKSFEIPITGIPIFSNRSLTMTPMVYNVNSGINGPKDLEGKRVGMRSYTATNICLTRMMLNYEFGIDVHKVNWVVTEDAHVAQYKEPANVSYAPEGRTLEDMILAGEIDAGIQVQSLGPDVQPLFSEEELDDIPLRYHRKTGLYPIGHLMTIKNEVLDTNPWIAPAMFRAFSASKELYLKELDERQAPDSRDQQSQRNREIVGADPLPFGLPKNRPHMQTMVDIDVYQKVIPTPLDVDSLFASNTLDLE